MNSTRTHSWTRRILVLLATVAAMVGIAAPAQAFGTPGVVQPQVSCLPGVMYIDPFVSVQNGYANGQFMSYRYHLTSTRGHNTTSGWSSSVLVPTATTSWGQTTTYGTSGLPQARIPATTGTLWQVWVEVARWNGYTYTYSGWVATATYQNVPRSSSSSCRT